MCMGDFTPSMVKHCQLGYVKLLLGASLLLMRMYLGRASRLVSTVVVALFLTGCATDKAPRPALSRPFNFASDTFSYSNQLHWEYRFDDVTGKTTTYNRNPPPDYALHCFVVARSARQFLNHARFDAGLALVSDDDYRHLVRKVVSRSARSVSPEDCKVLIPGFANLRELSEAKPELLKEECGGAWQSYFQRGHWRMIFPFTRRQRQRTAEELVEEVRANDTALVHVVTFPQLSINHAMLVFDAQDAGQEIRFCAYDPNNPLEPATLLFKKADATFEFPRNYYFIGGRVNVYEVFRGWLY